MGLRGHTDKGLRGLAAALLVVFGLAGCFQSSPAHTEQPPEIKPNVVAELIIGTDSGPHEYLLGRVQHVAVAPDGTIYVGEVQPFAAGGRESQIRVFDASGKHLRNLGRVGQGPGEYVYPEPNVLPDGRPVVWDGERRRVSVFSTDGTFQHSFAADTGRTPMRVDREGNIYLETAILQGAIRQLALRKYSADGVLLDTIPLPVEYPDPVNPGPTDFLLGPEGGLRPFTTMSLFALTPLGHLVVGRNDQYKIEVEHPEGSVRLTRGVEPARVAPEEYAEWDAFREVVVRRHRDRGADVEVLPIPAVKPFFRDFSVGQDGRIWVHRYVAATKRHGIEAIPSRPDRPLLTWRETATYDVFEPSGAYLGTVMLPVDFQPHVFRGRQIWGVSIDDSGVETVVRFGVAPDFVPGA